jgi:hypothetical protein
MTLSRAVPFLIAMLAAGTGAAQGVRDHTRPRARGTAVTEAQAEALTLTLSSVASRSIQSWIRTAGTIDKSRRILSASMSGPEAALVKAGQRVRVFPPSSKSSMYQAFVTRAVGAGDQRDIQVSLASEMRQETAFYVLEIVVDRPPLLSVPNEAIIEEGDRHIIYVQQAQGRYEPREIQIGIQGELFTQVLAGAADGDQVVTFGSFFIDAEQKLKGTDVGAGAGAH